MKENNFLNKNLDKSVKKNIFMDSDDIKIFKFISTIIMYLNSGECNIFDTDISKFQMLNKTIKNKFEKKYCEHKNLFSSGIETIYYIKTKDIKVFELQFIIYDCDKENVLMYMTY